MSIPGKKLSAEQLHLLRLATKDAGRYGWARVSDEVWPLVQKLPSDLVTCLEASGLRSVKLTEGGKAIVKYS